MNTTATHESETLNPTWLAAALHGHIRTLRLSGRNDGMVEDMEKAANALSATAAAAGQVIRDVVPHGASVDSASLAAPAGTFDEWARDKGLDDARSGVHEVTAGFDDLPFATCPESWTEKPFARIVWTQVSGDSSTGIPSQSGWSLAQDQAGTVVGDLVSQAASASSPTFPARGWTPATARLPAYEDSNDVHVLVYTEGYDFGGELVHDVPAADFYAGGDGDDELGTEVTRAASHWIYRSDAIGRIGQQDDSAPVGQASGQAVDWNYAAAVARLSELPQKSSIHSELLEQIGPDPKGQPAYRLRAQTRAMLDLLREAFTVSAKSA